MTATYVYKEREWVLTGRMATKRRPSGSDKEMVELHPVDDDPKIKTNNIWVEREQLYHVIGEDILGEK